MTSFVKKVNKIVTDITAATDAVLTKIGWQPAESVNTPTVAVVTITKKIVRGRASKDCGYQSRGPTCHS